MELIRKLEETAAALRHLAEQAQHAAEKTADSALREEMLESAEGWERRADEMEEAVLRWKLKIN
jgi:ribosomal protein S7